MRGLRDVDLGYEASRLQWRLRLPAVYAWRRLRRRLAAYARRLRRRALHVMIPAQLAAGALLWLCGDAALEPPRAWDFLGPSLQATAAATGIVFAISVIAIEHAASNYSPAILGRFMRDVRVWLAAGYGTATAVITGAAVLFELGISVLCFQLFAANLAVLPWYLRYVLGAIRPESIILWIRSDALGRIGDAAKKVRPGPVSYGDAQKLGAPARMSARDSALRAHHRLPVALERLEASLWQMIRSTRGRGDYDSTWLGLDAHAKILVSYLRLNPGWSWRRDRIVWLMLRRLSGYAHHAARSGDADLLMQAVRACGKASGHVALIGSVDEGGGALQRLVAGVGRAARRFEGGLDVEELEDVLKNLRGMGEESLRMNRGDGRAALEVVRIGDALMDAGCHEGGVECASQLYEMFRFRIALPEDAAFHRDFEEYAGYVERVAPKAEQDLFFELFMRHIHGYVPELLLNAVLGSEVPAEEAGRRVLAVFRMAGRVGLAGGDVMKESSARCMARMVRLCLRAGRDGPPCGPAAGATLEWLRSAYPDGEARAAWAAELAAACMDGGEGPCAVECAEACAEEVRAALEAVIDGGASLDEARRAMSWAVAVGCCALNALDAEALNRMVDRIARLDMKFEDRHGSSGIWPLAEGVWQSRGDVRDLERGAPNVTGAHHQETLARRVAARKEEIAASGGGG